MIPQKISPSAFTWKTDWRTKKVSGKMNSFVRACSVKMRFSVTLKGRNKCSRVLEYFFQVESYLNEDAFLLTAKWLPEHCVTFLKCFEQEDGVHTQFI